MKRENIAISPATREDIGKRVIARFVEKCVERGIQRIVTDSGDEEHLRRFYGSLGFRSSGVNYEMDTSSP